ncbi:MAG TPA: hypothetical protein PLG90_03570 [Ignavibacteria bacterium]|nr:hypothetical protein [Ignavibacteria bacterium]
MNEKTIFRLFLKTDYRDKEKNTYKRFLGIMISYIFANSFIGWSNYIRFDEFGFSVLAMSMNIFFITFIALTEYGELFFSKKQNEIFSSLPVLPEEIFAAKFKSAFLYIFSFVLVLLLPQIIFFAMYSGEVSRVLLFIIINISFTLFLLFLLLLLQSVSIVMSKGKSNKLVTVLQFIFVAFIVLTSTISSKGDQKGLTDIREIEAVKYLPQTYFYSGIENYLFLVLCLCLTLFLGFSFYFYMKMNYEKISDYLSFETKVKKKSFIPAKYLEGIQKFITAKFLNNNIEQAFYGLTKNQFANSKQLKLKNLPFVFLPLIFALIAVVGNQQGFLYFDSSKISSLGTGVLILGPSITMILIMSSRLLISGTKIADENSNDTDWIYKTIPVKENVWIFNGVNKFIYFNFLIPVFILVFLILLVRLDVLTVALNMIFIISGIIFINSIAGLFDKNFPFSLENTKHNSTSKFFEVLLTMVMGILVFIIQIFIFKNIYFILGLSAIFIILSALINRK